MTLLHILGDLEKCKVRKRESKAFGRNLPARTGVERLHEAFRTESGPVRPVDESHRVTVDGQRTANPEHLVAVEVLQVSSRIRGDSEEGGRV